MCRSRSVVERDILRFSQNTRSKIRTERLGRHQFNTPLENVLEQVDETIEVVEGLLIGIEFDQQIDITAVVLKTVYEGPEQTQSPNAACLNTASLAGESLKYVALLSYGTNHNAILAHERESIYHQ